MQSILIIGAGVAGLLAAQDLQKHGFDVTVLDKGRGLGGRMATRRINIGERTGKADHGVQYITAYTPRFTVTVAEMLEERILQPWNVNGDAAATPPKRSRYIAPEGMTSVAKYFARGLQTRLNERVHTLRAETTGWTALTDNHEYQADALLITAPIPQALMLLETAEQKVLSDEEHHALSSVEYIPCITLMLGLGDEYVSALGKRKMRFEGTRAVMWFADNREKGISPDVPTLTLHTSAEFAKEHWETREEELVPMLLDELSDYISKDLVQAYSLHRWRFSRVSKPYPARFFAATSAPAPLVLAGDAFAADTPIVTRVEDAALSGWAASEYLCGV